jgi:hypothetical protein
MALVDHTRAVQGVLHIPGYQNRVHAIFRDSVEHRFVQEVRNCVVHARLLPADWRTTILFGQGEETHFYIRKDILLGWKGWSPSVQAFIEKLDYGADIGRLFRTYSELVASFHDWYWQAIESAGGAELEEYRSCIRVIKGTGWRSSYGILLQIARSAKIDPFDRLSDYLYPSEIEAVLALSNRKAQVDKIIEILDTYRACDDWLREMAYQACGVASDEDGAR